jgi:hypothetical protein
LTLRAHDRFLLGVVLVHLPLVLRDVLRCHDSNRAALLNVAKALSQKLGPKGIRINRRRDLRRLH